MDRAPRKTLRLVVPGSVYYFQKTSGAPFHPDELSTLWLAAVGQRRNEGLGRIVPGRWDTVTDRNAGQ